MITHTYRRKSDTHTRRQTDSQTTSAFLWFSLYGHTHTHTHTIQPPQDLLLSVFISLSAATHAHTQTHTLPHTAKKSAFWKSLMTNAEMDKMAPHYKKLLLESAWIYFTVKDLSDYPRHHMYDLTYINHRTTRKKQPDSQSIFAANEMGTYLLLLSFFFFFVVVVLVVLSSSFCFFSQPKSKGS